MLSKAEEKVYSDLFRIVKENMESAGQEMIPLEEGFLAAVGAAPNTADVLQLRGMERRALVQAAYATILRRFPDDGARLSWEQRAATSEEEYCQSLIATLTGSAEYMQKGVRICNNIYSSAKKQPIQVIVQTGSSGVDRLKRIYSRMPAWMRNLIKKILK